MPREIKNFSSGQTYTVPTGRNAKIIFNFISPSGSSSLSVGSTFISSFGNNAMSSHFRPPNTSIPFAGGEQWVLGNSSGEFYIMPRVFYLSAGQSVSGSSVNYNFTAIEEY